MTAALTLRAIRRTKIARVIGLLNSEELSAKQAGAVLQIALLFLNNGNNDVRDLGYRLLLKYCVKRDDYVPLYDIASTLGFTPIAAFLHQQDLLPERDNFLGLFMEAYRENFKVGEAYFTENQRLLFSNFKESMGETVAVVAPTSYGKSQLIEETIEAEDLKNIAIVVPSKALISQTRRRVLASLKVERQVVVHHDMKIDLARPLIAVVTQERLLRIFQKHPGLAFDIVFIDEAHNMLSSDKRARLLASSIIINKLRNRVSTIKYLTPFLVSTDTLRLVNEDVEIKQIRVLEKLKSEEYFVCDLHSDGQIKLYDQYVDRFFEVGERGYTDEIKLLLEKKGAKNIVYLNKPKNIEIFAELLSRQTNDAPSPELQKICAEIADYVHPKYRILDCLRRGVAYHHGSVPDVVRAYIEKGFRKESSVNWIITNSTLLEGVNIPADKLFVLDPTKGQANLTAAQFRNLVGRVNRFSEIFDKDQGSPRLLLPAVYLINCRFSRSRANFEDYISRVAKVDRKLNDDPENPLLSSTPANDERADQRDEDFTFIENIEPSAVLRATPKIATTQAGRLCYVHNIYELDVRTHEQSLERDIQSAIASGARITDARKLMDFVAQLFIPRIGDETRENANLLRLKHPAARSFYAMFFDWRINQVNYGRMISNFIAYWNKIVANEPDTTVFVGRWGNVPRDGFVENYIDLSELSEYEMINLAIVRIKEEQDFIDNSLLKFVEVLNDAELVDEELYNKIKYGTSDADQISLIRSGFTHMAATVLVGRYRRYLSISDDGDVVISPGIRTAFKQRGEKELITFEVESSGLLRHEVEN